MLLTPSAIILEDVRPDGELIAVPVIIKVGRRIRAAQGTFTAAIGSNAASGMQRCIDIVSIAGACVQNTDSRAHTVRARGPKAACFSVTDFPNGRQLAPGMQAAFKVWPAAG